ncbi:hypothetical protein [Chelativorans sp. AA-79]|uniref:hypothetical protein n=1 Tax=Chelativorans sp. AA-79 TaxID=3028735 RepID=UPI0023F773D6|nr:hypothetical protein [Chelativorans sp. AA-79]WEX10313.1 hypothetical protein PVE73_04965 [Chelativorans sp. AA-79]
MNHFAGYTRAVPGGWWAMLRFAEDARPAPILGKGARPIVFASELEAQKAVTSHLLAYFNGDLRRHGEIAANPKAAAETFFRKGRRIEVEKRRPKYEDEAAA